MSLDCVIKVRAGSRRGRPHDISASVHRFIRDSEDYYRAVLKHLERCPDCDPREALQGFLDNRGGRKMGLTTQVLVLMAEKYERTFGDRVPNSLTRDFIRRCMSSHWTCFAKRAEKLTEEDIVRGREIEIEAWRYRMKASIKKIHVAIERGDDPSRALGLDIRPSGRVLNWLSRDFEDHIIKHHPRIRQLKKLLEAEEATPVEKLAGSDEEIIRTVRILEVSKVMRA